ncbi:MAG: hypothetical protein SGILL_009712 [Bacillariaceae sp.]
MTRQKFHADKLFDAPLCSNVQSPSQWDVDRYQEQHSFVWKYGSPLLELIDFKSSKSLSILDIGCGSGELARELARQPNVASVVGMDLDQKMIAQAQTESESLDNISFHVGDIRNFKSPEQFDVVFSNAALHWIPRKDMDRAVESIAASLRNGGQLVFEMGGKGNVYEICRAAEQVTAHTNPWCFPSVGEMSALLEKYGIEVTSAELFDRPTLLEDGEEGVTNWLRMFGSAFFEDMKTEEEVEEALIEIKQILLSTTELFDGENWMADYRRLRIVAKKKDGSSRVN